MVILEISCLVVCITYLARYALIRDIVVIINSVINGIAAVQILRKADIKSICMWILKFSLRLR